MMLPLPFRRGALVTRAKSAFSGQVDWFRIALASSASNPRRRLAFLAAICAAASVRGQEVSGIPKILIRISEVFFVIKHFDSIGALAQNCDLILLVTPASRAHRLLTAFIAALRARSEAGKRLYSSRSAVASAAERLTLLTGIHSYLFERPKT